MTLAITRIAGGALLFLIIFASGFILTRSGKPYNVGLLTVHKLLGAALFVLLIVILVRTQRAVPLGTVTLVVSLLAGLFFVALIATGGLLSADLSLPPVVTTLHHVAPYLTVAASAAILLMLPAR